MSFLHFMCKFNGGTLAYTYMQGGARIFRCLLRQVRRYPAPTGWVATLAEEDLHPPDPEPVDPGAPKPDIIKGLSLRMTQAMNHYQCKEWWCFVCGATDHLAWDCPHREAFCAYHKEHLNSRGVGPQLKEPTPKSPPAEVSVCVAMTCHA